MAQYIDKATLVAEIERIKKSISPDRFLSEFEKGCNQGKEDVCDDLLSFIDTLEVKDVNLYESLRYYLIYEHISPLNEVLHQVDLKAEIQYHKDIENAYKAGFEFGLKTKGE